MYDFIQASGKSSLNETTTRAATTVTPATTQSINQIGMYGQFYGLYSLERTDFESSQDSRHPWKM